MDAEVTHADPVDGSGDGPTRSSSGGTMEQQVTITHPVVGHGGGDGLKGVSSEDSEITSEIDFDAETATKNETEVASSLKDLENDAGITVEQNVAEIGTTGDGNLASQDEVPNVLENEEPMSVSEEKSAANDPGSVFVQGGENISLANVDFPSTQAGHQIEEEKDIDSSHDEQLSQNLVPDTNSPNHDGENALVDLLDDVQLAETTDDQELLATKESAEGKLEVDTALSDDLTGRVSPRHDNSSGTSEDLHDDLQNAETTDDQQSLATKGGEEGKSDVNTALSDDLTGRLSPQRDSTSGTSVDLHDDLQNADTTDDRVSLATKQSDEGKSKMDTALSDDVTGKVSLEHDRTPDASVDLHDDVQDAKTTDDQASIATKGSDEGKSEMDTVLSGDITGRDLSKHDTTPNASADLHDDIQHAKTNDQASIATKGSEEGKTEGDTALSDDLTGGISPKRDSTCDTSADFHDDLQQHVKDIDSQTSFAIKESEEHVSEENTATTDDSMGNVSLKCDSADNTSGSGHESVEQDVTHTDGEELVDTKDSEVGLSNVETAGSVTEITPDIPSVKKNDLVSGLLSELKTPVVEESGNDSPKSDKDKVTGILVADDNETSATKGDVELIEDATSEDCSNEVHVESGNKISNKNQQDVPQVIAEETQDENSKVSEEIDTASSGKNDDEDDIILISETPGDHSKKPVLTSVFKCARCGEICDTREDLNKHLLDAHKLIIISKRKSVDCLFCSKTIDMNEFHIHLRNDHKVMLVKSNQQGKGSAVPYQPPSNTESSSASGNLTSHGVVDLTSDDEDQSSKSPPATGTDKTQESTSKVKEGNAQSSDSLDCQPSTLSGQRGARLRTNVQKKYTENTSDDSQDEGSNVHIDDQDEEWQPGDDELPKRRVLRKRDASGKALTIELQKAKEEAAKAKTKEEAAKAKTKEAQAKQALPGAKKPHYILAQNENVVNALNNIKSAQVAQYKDQFYRVVETGGSKFLIPLKTVSTTASTTISNTSSTVPSQTHMPASTNTTLNAPVVQSTQTAQQVLSTGTPTSLQVGNIVTQPLNVVNPVQIGNVAVTPNNVTTGTTPLQPVNTIPQPTTLPPNTNLVLQPNAGQILTVPNLLSNVTSTNIAVNNLQQNQGTVVQLPGNQAPLILSSPGINPGQTLIFTLPQVQTNSVLQSNVSVGYQVMPQTMPTIVQTTPSLQTANGQLPQVVTNVVTSQQATSIPGKQVSLQSVAPPPKTVQVQNQPTQNRGAIKTGSQQTTAQPSSQASKEPVSLIRLQKPQTTTSRIAMKPSTAQVKSNHAASPAEKHNNSGSASPIVLEDSSTPISSGNIHVAKPANIKSSSLHKSGGLFALEVAMDTLTSPGTPAKKLVRKIAYIREPETIFVEQPKEPDPKSKETDVDPGFSERAKSIVAIAVSRQYITPSDLSMLSDKVLFECTRCGSCFPQWLLLVLHQSKCTRASPSGVADIRVHTPLSVIAEFYRSPNKHCMYTHCRFCNTKLIKVEYDNAVRPRHMSGHMKPSVNLVCLPVDDKVTYKKGKYAITAKALEWIDYIVPPFTLDNPPTSSKTGSLDSYLRSGPEVYDDSPVKKKKKKKKKKKDSRHDDDSDDRSSSRISSLRSNSNTYYGTLRPNLSMFMNKDEPGGSQMNRSRFHEETRLRMGVGRSMMYSFKSVRSPNKVKSTLTASVPIKAKHKQKGNEGQSSRRWNGGRNRSQTAGHWRKRSQRLYGAQDYDTSTPDNSTPDGSVGDVVQISSDEEPEMPQSDSLVGDNNSYSEAIDGTELSQPVDQKPASPVTLTEEDISDYLKMFDEADEMQSELPKSMTSNKQQDDGGNAAASSDLLDYYGNDVDSSLTCEPLIMEPEQVVCYYKNGSSKNKAQCQFRSCEVEVPKNIRAMLAHMRVHFQILVPQQLLASCNAKPSHRTIPRPLRLTYSQVQAHFTISDTQEANLHLGEVQQRFECKWKNCSRSRCYKKNICSHLVKHIFFNLISKPDYQGMVKSMSSLSDSPDSQNQPATRTFKIYSVNKDGQSVARIIRVPAAQANSQEALQAVVQQCLSSASPVSIPTDVLSQVISKYSTEQQGSDIRVSVKSVEHEMKDQPQSQAELDKFGARYPTLMAKMQNSSSWKFMSGTHQEQLPPQPSDPTPTSTPEDNSSWLPTISNVRSLTSSNPVKSGTAEQCSSSKLATNAYKLKRLDVPRWKFSVRRRVPVWKFYSRLSKKHLQKLHKKPGTDESVPGLKRKAECLGSGDELESGEKRRLIENTEVQSDNDASKVELNMETQDAVLPEESLQTCDQDAQVPVTDENPTAGVLVDSDGTISADKLDVKPTNPDIAYISARNDSTSDVPGGDAPSQDSPEEKEDIGNENSNSTPETTVPSECTDKAPNNQCSDETPKASADDNIENASCTQNDLAKVTESSAEICSERDAITADTNVEGKSATHDEHDKKLVSTCTDAMEEVSGESCSKPTELIDDSSVTKNADEATPPKQTNGAEDRELTGGSSLTKNADEAISTNQTNVAKDDELIDESSVTKDADEAISAKQTNVAADTELIGESSLAKNVDDDSTAKQTNVAEDKELKRIENSDLSSSHDDTNAVIEVLASAHTEHKQTDTDDQRTGKENAIAESVVHCQRAKMIKSRVVLGLSTNNIVDAFRFRKARKGKVVRIEGRGYGVGAFRCRIRGCKFFHEVMKNDKTMETVRALALHINDTHVKKRTRRRPFIFFPKTRFPSVPVKKFLRLFKDGSPNQDLKKVKTADKFQRISVGLSRLAEIGGRRIRIQRQLFHKCLAAGCYFGCLNATLNALLRHLKAHLLRAYHKKERRMPPSFSNDGSQASEADKSAGSTEDASENQHPLPTSIDMVPPSCSAEQSTDSTDINIPGDHELEPDNEKMDLTSASDVGMDADRDTVDENKDDEEEPMDVDERSEGDCDRYDATDASEISTAVVPKKDDAEDVQDDTSAVKDDVGTGGGNGTSDMNADCTSQEDDNLNSNCKEEEEEEETAVEKYTGTDESERQEVPSENNIDAAIGTNASSVASEVSVERTAPSPPSPRGDSSRVSALRDMDELMSHEGDSIELYFKQVEAFFTSYTAKISQTKEFGMEYFLCPKCPQTKLRGGELPCHLQSHIGKTVKLNLVQGGRGCVSVKDDIPEGGACDVENVSGDKTSQDALQSSLSMTSQACLEEDLPDQMDSELSVEQVEQVEHPKEQANDTSFEKDEDTLYISEEEIMDQFFTKDLAQSVAKSKSDGSVPYGLERLYCRRCTYSTITILDALSHVAFHLKKKYYVLQKQ